MHNSSAPGINHDGLWRGDHDWIPGDVELRSHTDHCRHLSSHLKNSNWTKLVAIWDDPNLNRVHSQDLRTSGNKHQSLLLITDWSTFETPSYNLVQKPEWHLWNLSARPLWLQGWEFFWLGEQEPLGVQPVCLPPPIMAVKNKQKLANHDATSGENGKKSKICLTLSARLGDTYRPFALFASVMAFKVLSCT